MENSSAWSPHEADCRENIVFKLITCFMYLDGRTSRGYIGSLWIPSGQKEEMKSTEINNGTFFQIAPWENKFYVMWVAQYITLWDDFILPFVSQEFDLDSESWPCVLNASNNTFNQWISKNSHRNKKQSILITRSMWRNLRESNQGGSFSRDKQTCDRCWVYKWIINIQHRGPLAQRLVRRFNFRLRKTSGNVIPSISPFNTISVIKAKNTLNPNDKNLL